MPTPAQVAVELVGGPRCGSEAVAPIGPHGGPPPLLALEDGSYRRTDRIITKATGAIRVAYQWRQL